MAAPAISDDFTLPEGRDLRTHTAGGVLVNAAFNIAIAVIETVRRIAVAGFLTASDFGLWALIFVSMNTVLMLKVVGIGDKYVQQSEPDQQLAYQKAFTIEVVLTGIIFVACVVLLPVFALIYGQSRIIAPGLALSMMLPLSLLSFPSVVLYRRMDFARQRRLAAADPVVSFTVTVTLAASGAGVWSLVIGSLSGALASGLLFATRAPYPFGWRHDRETLRSYFRFSWPLAVGQGSRLVGIQGIAIAGTSKVGLSGLGALGLGQNFAGLADGVDSIVTNTMYPALCRIADRIDTLHEAFVKSNRLALIWGMPFGLAMALFADDMVHDIFGDQWVRAIPVLAMTGVTIAISQVGYNWSAFMRARADTKGIGVVAVGTMLTTVGILVPSLVIWGLKGVVWGMLAQAVVSLLLRTHYLRKMFPGFTMTRHLLRAVVPSVPAVAMILVLRPLEHGPRTLFTAAAELVIYAIVTGVATWFAERRLLTEAFGYLARAVPSWRSRPAPAGP